MGWLDVKLTGLLVEESNGDGIFDGDAEWELATGATLSFPPSTPIPVGTPLFDFYTFKNNSVDDAEFFSFDDELVLSGQIPLGTVLSLHASGEEVDFPRMASDELPTSFLRINLTEEIHQQITTHAEGGWDVGPIRSTPTDFSYTLFWEVHFTPNTALIQNATDDSSGISNEDTGGNAVFQPSNTLISHDLENGLFQSDLFFV
jgi:hypothetical protein